MYLSKSETAPATTGDATLVPDNERQPPLIKVQTENTIHLTQIPATDWAAYVLILTKNHSTTEYILETRTSNSRTVGHNIWFDSSISTW